MVDWKASVWQDGDTLEYHDMKPNQPKQTIQIFPGLYWYSGLGSGNLFLKDDKDGNTIIQNISPQEACATCRARNVEMRYVDSFINTGHCISLKD